MQENVLHDDLMQLSPTMPLKTFIAILAASAAGAAAAILLLPIVLPGLDASLVGSSPQVFWFLSRSSALVAYVLLWSSMSLGLLITNKLARLWPGGPLAFDLHQHTSLLGVAFALFHALVLLGDRYLNTTLWRTALPFAMQEYRPGWVGLGQLSFYLMALVAFSFYIRRQITPRLWRLIHYVSFLTFLMALLHAIASGTDTQAPWAYYLYSITAALFLFFLIYRLIVSVFKPRPAARPSTTAGSLPIIKRTP